MDAIHINTTLDSDTLYLPQVRPLIGKTVEIIVQEQTATGERRQNGPSHQRGVWKAALAELNDLDIDWNAYKRQRELDVRDTDQRTA